MNKFKIPLIISLLIISFVDISLATQNDGVKSPKSAAIFCASSNKISSNFFDIAKNVGYTLAKENIKIFFGGANTGLMGALLPMKH
jgi:predicted Rossmann-fold nucleotide-binding protein